jgi:signal transduction histidine kinase
MAVTGHERSLEELERVAAEQAALRRIATLVAEGATERELGAAVTSEIGRFFGAQRANTMRWHGDTLRVIGSWNIDEGEVPTTGLVVPYGGDTVTARIVETGAPARVDSVAELQTDFARERWAEFGLQASVGAPIMVDGKVWGVVMASRTRPDDPFPPGTEHRLRDFAALVAQAIVNAEARRETAELIAEQTALRKIATLVAAGRPQAEVLDAVTSETGRLFAATTVTLVRWEGVLDEVVVVAAWNDSGNAPVEPGTLYHPEPGRATLRVLETGLASRSDETSPERGPLSVIAAPVIVKASLLAALTASRPQRDAFPPGAEIRLRSFADLAAQSISNERAQAELRASRARIVRAADDTRQRLERNLHDGAQQRLVSVSVALRLAGSTLPESPEEAGALIAGAAEELSLALEELRDLARGLHPAVLSRYGLGPALDALVNRAPLPVTVANEIEERLPPSVEAAVYYVVAESVTNCVKHASASSVRVRTACAGGFAEIEVVDDGVGGASLAGGSGLLGLTDRVEALGGRFSIQSTPGKGTRVRAEIPLTAELDTEPPRLDSL